MACPRGRIWASSAWPTDRRPKVIVELGVVTALVVLAAMAITGGQRPIDAAEIGGIVGEWLTHTPTMPVLERSRFDAAGLD